MNEILNKLHEAAASPRAQMDGYLAQGKKIVLCAPVYTPEELIGKKIIFVANLAPAKLCGEESNGMLLACDAGEKVQVVFLDKDTPNGSTVR